MFSSVVVFQIVIHVRLLQVIKSYKQPVQQIAFLFMITAIDNQHLHWPVSNDSFLPVFLYVLLCNHEYFHYLNHRQANDYITRCNKTERKLQFERRQCLLYQRRSLPGCDLLLLSVSTNIKYTPAIVGRIFGHSHCRLQGRLLCTLAPRQDTGVDAAWSEVQFCSRKLHLRLRLYHYRP